jgi:hypothetical protein
MQHRHLLSQGSEPVAVATFKLLFSARFGTCTTSLSLYSTSGASVFAASSDSFGMSTLWAIALIVLGCMMLIVLQFRHAN